MKRRDLLASAGGIGFLALAGCTARGDDSGDQDDPTTTPTDDPTTTPPGGQAGDDWAPDGDEPALSLSVGDRDGVAFPENNGPHGLRVWNATDVDRTVTISLRETDTDVVLERTVALSADAWVRVELLAPATYELTVGVENGPSETLTVERSWFDCNGSVTTVAVRPNEVESRTISTALGCPGPEVAGASLTAGEGECGGGGEASVAFGDEAVAVTGTLATPTPCYDVALASVGLAGESDDGDETLRVVVEPGDQASGGCVECVGGVPYEASVAMDHAYPDRVRVVHDGAMGRRTVAEVTR